MAEMKPVQLKVRSDADASATPACAAARRVCERVCGRRVHLSGNVPTDITKSAPLGPGRVSAASRPADARLDRRQRRSPRRTARHDCRGRGLCTCAKRCGLMRRERRSARPLHVLEMLQGAPVDRRIVCL